MNKNLDKCLQELFFSEEIIVFTRKSQIIELKV